MSVLYNFTILSGMLDGNNFRALDNNTSIIFETNNKNLPLLFRNPAELFNEGHFVFDFINVNFSSVN